MDFLTTTEVTNYTGYKRPSDQIRQLIKMSVPHDIDGRGKPVVLRSTIISRLDPDPSRTSASKSRPRIKIPTS